MIRSPVRRHHHRSRSPIPEPPRSREREHRSSHSKRSHEDEEENGRHRRHHREQEHVKERSHREKESSERRRSGTSRGEHDKDRHVVKEKEEKRSKRKHSESPRMERIRSRVHDEEEREEKISDRFKRKHSESPRKEMVERNRNGRPSSSVSPSRRSRGRVHDEVREEKSLDRSKRKHSESPRMERMERNRNGRPSTSVSPSRRSRGRVHAEVSSPRANEHRNENDSVAKMKAAEEALEAKKKEEPSFELSGKLAEETNRVRGVTLLFTEPPDARKPDIRWRLYVFKGGEVLNEPLYIHRQSCYLFGRERRVADVPTDHPSCSKQHAVIQFRLVEKELPDGMTSKQVRPYLMDLGSTNGTFLNENRIESERYYELIEKDTIKFGNSSREYVMLHENSA